MAGNNISVSEASVEVLTPFMCMMTFLPKSGIDCSTLNSSICVTCRNHFEYFWGDNLNVFSSTGYTISLIFAGLSVIIGIFGVIGNLLIIMVLKERITCCKGFDFLLVVLACFDLYCCTVGVIVSLCYAIYFGTWNGESLIFMYTFHLSWLLLLFGRSGSQYMTLAVSFERYLVITFPFQSSTWITAKRTKILTLFLASAILLAIPRSTATVITENIHADIPSLSHLKYYMTFFKKSQFWFGRTASILYQIDFWLPLPLIFIFNLLTYFQMQIVSRRRKLLNATQRQEIQAVKMFLPVVIALVCLNSAPITLFLMFNYGTTVYRELYISTILSITLNSAINFYVYYRTKAFKTESIAVLGKLFGKSLTMTNSR